MKNHFFTYTRSCSGVWRLLDDQKVVTLVSYANVLRDLSETNAYPIILIYERLYEDENFQKQSTEDMKEALEVYNVFHRQQIEIDSLMEDDNDNIDGELT